MSELLAKALSPQMVNLAWRRLRSDRAVWAPGISRAEMEPNFAHHLLQLVDEVRAGRYRPHPLRQFAIAKGDGGQRVLSALCLRDKLAQRLVLNVLDPIGEALFHHDSFGYRPGRNVDMALDFVRNRAEALGLELHPDKTRMIRSNPKYKFLGKSLPRPCAPIGSGGQPPTWKSRVPALQSRR